MAKGPSIIFAHQRSLNGRVSSFLPGFPDGLHHPRKPLPAVLWLVVGVQPTGVHLHDGPGGSARDGGVRPTGNPQPQRPAREIPGLADLSVALGTRMEEWLGAVLAPLWGGGVRLGAGWPVGPCASVGDVGCRCWCLHRREISALQLLLGITFWSTSVAKPVPERVGSSGSVLQRCRTDQASRLQPWLQDGYLAVKMSDQFGLTLIFLYVTLKYYWPVNYIICPLYL